MPTPPLYRYDSVPSTNDTLKSLAAQGAPEGTAVIARHQSAGRGRLGRSFESAAGLGLYLSVLWRPICRAEAFLPLTAMAAVTTANAIARTTGAAVQIKWPNDLVLSGKKLAGLLTESALHSDGSVDYVILGLGLNVAQTPADFSPQVAAIATSLTQVLGRCPHLPELEEALIDALRQAARHLSAPETYLDDYRRLCLNMGKLCRLSDRAEPVEAVDIDRDYGLVVRCDDGSLETVRCGEVSVRGLYGYLP